VVGVSSGSQVYARSLCCPCRQFIPSPSI
jgi:hypothetical protein